MNEGCLVPKKISAVQFADNQGENRLSDHQVRLVLATLAVAS